jgi:hypothetical protein
MRRRVGVLGLMKIQKTNNIQRRNYHSNAWLTLQGRERLTKAMNQEGWKGSRIVPHAPIAVLVVHPGAQEAVILSMRSLVSNSGARQHHGGSIRKSTPSPITTPNWFFPGTDHRQGSAVR